MREERGEVGGEDLIDEPGEDSFSGTISIKSLRVNISHSSELLLLSYA